GTLFAKDQKMQDLEESSDLEESEYSFQTAMEELEENKESLKLIFQKAQNNDKENLQSELSTDAEEPEQLCDQQVTGAHLELERMRWHFVLVKLKCEQDDKEKQRLHEERMAQLHRQAVNEGLQNLLQPLNQYALFLYCFIIIHVIYTLKELAFYIFQTHYLISAIITCLIKETQLIS
uniref:Uncharacterized protein n=1 Tax=Amazona collaria TaxID=241587 RepID=A0A8B9GJ61_9PSIT